MTFNILLGFRSYFVPFAAHRMLLDKDDIEWLKIKPLQMLGFIERQRAAAAGCLQRRAESLYVRRHPGHDRHHAQRDRDDLQRVLPPIWKQIAQPIHWVSVFAIVAGLIIHVYMGAVFPEEKEAFFSMFSGKVSAWYARAHHEKWYNEKLKKSALGREVDAQETLKPRNR